MVNVAIAGGTSPTLGKSITEAILATRRHKITILTRESTESNSTNAKNFKYGAPLVPVDYSSPTSLTRILQTYKIHSLISLLKPTSSPNASLEVHSRLLDAAQSARVSRFVLSDFSLFPPSHDQVDLLAHKRELHDLGQNHMATAAARGDHVFECCTIQTGGFMEYFVQGCPHPQVQAGLHDDLMLQYIDIANRHLVVPCVKPGVPARISMTSLIDIGKYISASLELPPGSMTGQIGVTSDTFPFTRVIEILAGLEPPIEITPVYMTREECEERAERYGREMEGKLRDTEDFDVKLLMFRMASQMVSCLCGEEERVGIVIGRTLNEMCEGVERVGLEELLKRGWRREG